MPTTLDELKQHVLITAPPLHSSWVEAEDILKDAPPASNGTVGAERQLLYAQECRELLAKSTAQGTRDHDLSQGVLRREFMIPSTIDEYRIPILQLDREKDRNTPPEIIVIYYHGGGLNVGEADSEEFSCRRLVKHAPKIRVYSIGYRLKHNNPSSRCVSDSLDGFDALKSLKAKNIVIGSSSGGQLGATVAQLRKEHIHGVLLRSPVTCDASNGKRFIPEWLRPYHTSLAPDFESYLLGTLKRTNPRDGLLTLPLETPREKLLNHPRTWIQICTNDILYSDGLCYAMALANAGIEVAIDVQTGWPHTFWLKVPHIKEALEADLAMLKGSDWILG